MIDAEIVEGDLTSTPFTHFIYAIKEENNIALTWADTATDKKVVRYYQIKRNDEIITELSSESSLYIDSHLDIGDYSYQLLVFYKNNLFSFSEDEINFTIDSIYPTIGYGTPTQLVHYIENQHDVVLRWDIPLRGEQKPIFYEIYRDDVVIVQVGGDTSIYFDINLSTGTYSYQLSAYYDDGTNKTLEGTRVVTIEDGSGNTPIFIAEDEQYIRNLIDTVEETPIFPEDFSYIVSDNSVNLTWTHPDGRLHPVYYQIERNGDIIVEIEGDLNSYVDSDLADGTYIYRLAAYYNDSLVLFAKAWAVCTIFGCD